MKAIDLTVALIEILDLLERPTPSVKEACEQITKLHDEALVEVESEFFSMKVMFEFMEKNNLANGEAN